MLRDQVQQKDCHVKPEHLIVWLPRMMQPSRNVVGRTAIRHQHRERQGSQIVWIAKAKVIDVDYPREITLGRHNHIFCCCVV